MENITKLRLLYLYQLLVTRSDAEHPITTNQLIGLLKAEHGIDVNRNTIGNDLEIMHESGLQIEVKRSTQNQYYYDGKIFDLPEMKLLVDAVSSSKFITEKKSEQLIEKLLTLLPVHNAEKLQRHIYAADRVKSENERGYYIVDAINEAMDTGRKISFFYTDYDVHKNRYICNDGLPYTLSPYTLIWDGDYYYVRGYCDEREDMRNFRLDRIDAAPLILQEETVPQPEDYNVADYSREVFRMYDTDEPENVELYCHVSMMKVLIDNFGLEVDTEPVDEEHFIAKVMVCTSPTFYRWVFGFGGKLRIRGPEDIVSKYRELLQEALQ